MAKKIAGFTIVDSCGLVLGWRATSSKAWDRRDEYASRGVLVSVHCAQLLPDEIALLERNEVSRGPIAMQMGMQGAA